MESLSIVIMNWRDVRNPAAGGAEVFTHEVARRWAARGHDVSLLTSAFTKAPRQEHLDGVRVIRRGDRYTVYRHVRRLYQELFAGGVDVAIDEINTRPFFATRFVNGRTRLFALIHQLAREFWSYDTQFPLSVIGRYWLEDRWLRPYRGIPTVTVSDSTRRDLAALGFRDVTVVPNGVSVTQLGCVPEKEEVPTAIYVGRLKRTKLPDHALRAFAVVLQKLPAAQLWVVGDGPMRTSLQRVAPPHTKFFGRVSDDEKARLMGRAHVLLSPAVREGWGLTVIEANAVGTPAVGYRVPGLVDSVRHGETGLLVPFGDVSRLGETTALLLAEPTARRALAENGLRWSKRFSWDSTAVQLLNRLQRAENSIGYSDAG